MPQKATHSARPHGRRSSRALPAGIGVPIVANHSVRHALPAGSLVLTTRGERLVEGLRPGDEVITRDHGKATVREIVVASTTTRDRMVHITQGCLGNHRPDRDLRLPPDQPVVLRDWRALTLFGAKEARVAVGRLIDGQLIRMGDSAEATVYSIVLDWPAALFVDGLEIVSGSVGAIEALRSA
ncbi:Hint domain-containing protein [Jannaschia sp. M317]|uniref:Hint domain-containing protein n=1 Tax=Jannaschia sp. M317 TaxID=2867011 RepID=UPI0021A6D074|nr:Hint domain-containing protein [Jannaschia sp. M317]UWQ16203.1 Hint domain-containing protein [Jannaschia sp. M317]